MSATLLTLAEAKQHLRVTSTYDDADITQKALEASDILRDYLKSMNNPDWHDGNVPTPIKAAVKLMLTHLYEHRGDDPETDEQLWAAIDRLVIRFRHPALA